MIELQNVTKIYEGTTKAVDEISFTVKEGKIFGLIGTSGCGKTTTLKMINRLEEPTSGTISIAGESILKQPPEQLRRNIGYVIQNVGLFPHYSVQENIAITPKLLDWKTERIEERNTELLHMVGLDEQQYANRKPADLSGGQQQRVGLARAMAADPPVILMDEPFGALDPITKERIQLEFKQLLKEIKKTIVLVTHDVFEAFDLCDRIGLMDEGKMQQIGTPRELLCEPANNFVHSFFNNHRLQLEMMSVTVGDILKVLNNESDKVESPPSKGEGFGDSRIKGDDRTVSVNDSFFSVFGDTHSENEKCVVLNDDGEPFATTTADKLLKGFQTVRRNLKEGRND